MRKIGIIIWAFIAFSCNSNLSKRPVGTSGLVSPGQISIGGILAELKDSASAAISEEDKRPLFVSKIDQLMDQSESLKAERKSLDQPDFLEQWNRLNYEFLLKLEKLTFSDVNAWIGLNDSLLKYSKKFGMLMHLNERFTIILVNIVWMPIS